MSQHQVSLTSECTTWLNDWPASDTPASNRASVRSASDEPSPPSPWKASRKVFIPRKCAARLVNPLERSLALVKQIRGNRLGTGSHRVHRRRRTPSRSRCGRRESREIYTPSTQSWISEDGISEKKATQTQKAVTAYFSRKQLLLFAFAELAQSGDQVMFSWHIQMNLINRFINLHPLRGCRNSRLVVKEDELKRVA